MKSCIDVFIHNGLQRYNLLNSALIELFEFIRANNIKGLVSYLGCQCDVYPLLTLC